MDYLKITWKKSTIGGTERQRRVIASLGLRRLHHTVMHRDSPTISGMVQKVIHLLEVERIAEPAKTAGKARSRRAA